MTIAEELQARKEHLLSPDVTWVPGTPRESGRSCLGYDWHETRQLRLALSSDALDFLLVQLAPLGVAQFNDRCTFSEVMDMLDDAIIAAKEAGA